MTYKWGHILLGISDYSSWDNLIKLAFRQQLFHEGDDVRISGMQGKWNYLSIRFPCIALCKRF
jgi:hypothetical protein